MIVKKSQNELFHGSKISILHPTPHHHLGAYVAVCSRLPIYHLHVLFMVALCNRADHYIFMLLFVLVLLLLSSFFPRLISAAGDWMFTILWHMVWP